MSYGLMYPHVENSTDRSSFEGTYRLFDAIPNYAPFEKMMETKAKLKDLTVGENIKISTPDFYLEPQEEGGFVAFSREFPGAVGQGETEGEAIKDLEEAIQLLKEVLEEDKVLEEER